MHRFRNRNRSCLPGGRVVAAAFLMGCAGVVFAFQAASTDVHRPAPFPDRVVLNLTTAPATSIAVTWRTDTSVGESFGEIAVSEDGPEFVRKSWKVKASTQAYATNLGPAHSHSVIFEGLQPGTQYLYRVGDGKNWTEWNQTRTAHTHAAPFRFIYLGDAQNGIYSLWSRLVRQAYSAAPDALFVVHAGDLISSSNKDEQWGEWHAAAGWINRVLPSLPVPGNHEYGRDESGQRRISVNWRPQFSLPLNGVAGLEESCYYVDIQGLRFIGLNSNEKQKEQAEWLDRLLQNNPNQWTVIAFHHPIYSTARGRDNKELRAMWQPVFDKHQVDLVLHGHDHTYGRTNLMTGVNRATDPAGTVYVVSVSGPKMYDRSAKLPFAREAEDTQLYQVIRIDGKELQFDAYTSRGILYDAFTLRKRPGKGNELLNRTPATPPNLRKHPVAAAAQ